MRSNHRRRRLHLRRSARPAEPDLPHIGQPRELRRHRPKSPRAVPGRSHKGRFRGSTKTACKQERHVVHAGARRPRLSDADCRRRPPFAKASSCPLSRPVNDAAGRIIIFVIDDLHLDFRDTHRVRRLFREMAKELVHDGDLFGIVSTGTSSIAIDLTYDRTRMEEAANRITGGGLKPSEIIQQSSTGETPQEVMHRANVAFETVYDMLNNLAADAASPQGGRAHQQRLRFRSVRLVARRHRGQRLSEQSQCRSERSVQFANEPGQSVQRRRAVDAARRADAAGQPRERHVLHLRPTRPRGRAAISTSRWIRSSGNSTSGSRRTACACLPSRPAGLPSSTRTIPRKALKRIDAETSDYYVLGYYSTNPDPTQRRRQIEIRLKKKDPEGNNLEVIYRREYTLKPSAARGKG